jgi:hypothetical protein
MIPFFKESFLKNLFLVVRVSPPAPTLYASLSVSENLLIRIRS